MRSERTKKTYLDIRKLTGADTVSREDGKKIRKVIELFWKSKDKIIVDFSNSSIASPSFFDEAFAKLILKYPLDEVKKKLSFKEMTKFDRAMLNDLVMMRSSLNKRDKHLKA